MSDCEVVRHVIICDWPGCDKTTEAACPPWKSYKDGLEEVGYDDDRLRRLNAADGHITGDRLWMHTADDRDYCPDHWYYDEEVHMTPGDVSHTWW